MEELRWVSGPEEGGVAGGKGMLLRGKRPEEVGAWPSEEVVPLQYCPHSDEEAVHVSDDLLRALWERRACEIDCMQICVGVAVPA